MPAESSPSLFGVCPEQEHHGQKGQNQTGTILSSTLPGAAGRQGGPGVVTVSCVDRAVIESPFARVTVHEEDRSPVAERGDLRKETSRRESSA